MSVKGTIIFDRNSQEIQTGQGLTAKPGVNGHHHVRSLGLWNWAHHLNIEEKNNQKKGT